MDISKFTDRKTGRLVPITQPEPDHAFIPDPLPARWEFELRLWPLLALANKRLGVLDGTARTLPNPQLFLKPLQRVEALTSSRLEGTYATAQELILFEMDPKESSNPNDASAAWREVANYNRALALGYQQLEELPFCGRIIKDLHRALMAGVRGSAKNPGEYRQHQVHIGSTRRYVPPPPDEMRTAINDFESYLNNNHQNGLDPLIKCFIAHYQIEAIHPFGDGNGRIGRVLLSLMIYKLCELEMPWLYLSPYFEQYKDEYINHMFRISTDGAWGNWIEFCLRGVIDQATKSVDLCDSLRALKDDMHERVRPDNRPRVHTIIDGLFDAPLVRVTDLAKTNNVRYPTAKADVDYLQSRQILAPLPNTKVKTYYSPEIFHIAYRDERNF